MDQGVNSCIPNDVIWLTKDTFAKLRIWLMAIVSILLIIVGDTILLAAPDKAATGIILLIAAMVTTFWASYLNIMYSFANQTKDIFCRYCLLFMLPLLFLPLKASLVIWYVNLPANQVRTYGIASQIEAAYCFGLLFILGYVVCTIFSAIITTETK